MTPDRSLPVVVSWKFFALMKFDPVNLLSVWSNLLTSRCPLASGGMAVMC